MKRRKVVEEFYETEKAYVDGLQMIYSHFLTPIITSLDTLEPLLDRSSLTDIFSNFIDIWNLHRSFFSSLTTVLTASALPSSAPISLTDLITPPSSTRPNPKYNATFATFLAEQEADLQCGKLKLRDWLLTIVQRCPRYLLLLKDLISCTDEEDPEHAQLMAAHALVSKSKSKYSKKVFHALTEQKVAASLNSSLHVHAQILGLLSLQRATANLPFQLIVPGRSLLKRGPLLQIEPSGQPREREFLLFSDCLIWLAAEESERPQWKGDWGISRSGWGSGYTESTSVVDASVSSSPQERPQMQRSRSKSEAELSLLRMDSHTSLPDGQAQTPTTPTKPNGRNGRRKSYHPPSEMLARRSSSNGGDDRWVYKGRIELVDLEVVVTPSREEGEERRFEILSPEGSFALYSGTEEDRDEWCSEMRQAKAQLLVSLNLTHPNSTLTSSSSTNHLRRSLQALPFPPSDDRVPDKDEGKGSKGKGKTDDESRERRRKTFFISDTHAKDDSSKPARACDACYETVFPLVDPSPGDTIDVTGTIHKGGSPIQSLSSMTWLSMTHLPVAATPQALMTIDLEPSSPTQRGLQSSSTLDDDNYRRVKTRPMQISRPSSRSYDQHPEDFEQAEYGRFDVLDAPLEEDDGGENFDNGLGPGRQSRASSNGYTPLPSSPIKENSARRNKRFSVPAVGIHTTSVTARTSGIDGHSSNAGKFDKRFSLVLGANRSHGAPNAAAGSDGMDHKPVVGKSVVMGKLSELLGRKRDR
ncbi:hypothetical protein H0H92_004290 [Tricholoma furcatifolium]|nr:hypothetical protein H0H92_004290 [Tricholoma furcatifolium]